MNLHFTARQNCDKPIILLTKKDLTEALLCLLYSWIEMRASAIRNPLGAYLLFALVQSSNC